jgi:hypothetical protein
MPISLVCVDEIPLSSSAVYKKIEAGVFPRPIPLKGRSWWLKKEIDAWFHPAETMELIRERRNALPGGFTEAEMRARGWKGLNNRGLNERALKMLVQEGVLERKKLATGGRPRMKYRWCL